jgi:hypothetical protein
MRFAHKNGGELRLEKPVNSDGASEGNLDIQQPVNRVLPLTFTVEFTFSRGFESYLRSQPI